MRPQNENYYVLLPSSLAHGGSFAITTGTCPASGQGCGGDAGRGGDTCRVCAHRDRCQGLMFAGCTRVRIGFMYLPDASQMHFSRASLYALQSGQPIQSCISMWFCAKNPAVDSVPRQRLQHSQWLSLNLKLTLRMAAEAIK